MTSESIQAADNINKYIEEICRLLELKSVKVLAGVERFHLDACEEKPMSVYIPEEDILYVERLSEPTPKLLYYIAYGLRHAWQKRRFPKTYYSEYRQLFQCETFQIFALQEAEIDANAFANIIMKGYFRLEYEYNSTRWHGVGELIRLREGEILSSRLHSGKPTSYTKVGGE